MPSDAQEFTSGKAADPSDEQKITSGKAADPSEEQEIASGREDGSLDGEDESLEKKYV